MRKYECLLIVIVIGFLVSFIGCEESSEPEVVDPEPEVTEPVETPPEDTPLEGMVLIPAGEFQMGSNDEESNGDEQPISTVYVDAFYMDETEVTNAQFKAFPIENQHWQKEQIEAHSMLVAI